MHPRCTCCLVQCVSTDLSYNGDVINRFCVLTSSNRKAINYMRRSHSKTVEAQLGKITNDSSI